MLLPGDPAPFFEVPSSVNRKFHFDTAAGRYIVLTFFESSQIPSSERFLTRIVNAGQRFDVTNAIFFGVTNDPDDVQRILHQDPGRVYFHDLDGAVSRKYGVTDDTTGRLTRTTFVLDRALRIIGILPLTDDNVGEHVAALFALLDSLPRAESAALPAPVMVVPYVFEAELCRRLIEYYETTGGQDSGFMRDVGGKTVGIVDYSHKRRMDCEITDDSLIRATQERIKRRIVPAIRQAHQFHATRIERHIVACYDAAQGAHFRAHRDNTTLGTAHRRFAVTINLNSRDYEGGEIWFPEFGPKRYKAASGDAIIFSCSLLHEVPRVTRGKRYAFLPFLYDDAAASIREHNRRHLGVLSAGVHGKVEGACNTPGAPFSSAQVVLDGSAGCGHPDGCETCLTSATYQLGVPDPASVESPRTSGPR